MNILDFDSPVTLSMDGEGGPFIEIAKDNPLVRDARRRRRAESGDDDDAGAGLELSQSALARDPTLPPPIVRDAYRRRLAESKRLKGQR